MKKDNLLKKTEVLAKAIAMLAPLYHDKNLDESQRGLLETLIGAGIWYLPNSKVLFSGKISKAALEKIKVDPAVKLVQEHGFPRKVAGNKLFNEHLFEIIKDTDALCNLFLEKFGRYNLVLKEENLQLKKYQKTALFVSEDEAYNLAGIELVNLEEEHFDFPQLRMYRIKEIIINEPEFSDELINEINEELIESNEDFIEDTDSDIANDLNEETVFYLKNENDKNPSQQYERFLQFVIDNFSLELENTKLLNSYIKRSAADQSFGKSITYNRVKYYNGYYYSTWASTQAKETRINIIAKELEIILVA